MSNIGGLLGLMAGCSFLSFMELVYFVFMRPVLDKMSERKNRQVLPLTDQSTVKTQTKFVSSMVEFLENSSIHSAQYIAKRSSIEK